MTETVEIQRPTLDQIIERYRVPTDGAGFRLDALDTRDKHFFPKRKLGEASTADDTARIDALQDILFAGQKRALLIVLQAMDCGGKDGTVRKVFGPVDPLGIRAVSFRKPSAQERIQDYLWRVHKVVPPRGMIGIFNRSHYEDVLVVRVHGLVPPERLEARYDQINAFERHLAENDVTILKFYLHISKAEQKERLQERLDDPLKHWKFNPGDLGERALWDDYMAAYEIALARCSTPWAPWYVIPADRKWYRSAIIARIIRETLEGLDLRYPEAAPGLDKISID